MKWCGRFGRSAAQAINQVSDHSEIHHQGSHPEQVEALKDFEDLDRHERRRCHDGEVLGPAQPQPEAQAFRSEEPGVQKPSQSQDLQSAG